MITITNLSFAYKEEDFVLENINIQFQPSMVQGIVGLNGSGKTTFFNLLTGFYKADKGSILINGLSKQLKGNIEVKNNGLGLKYKVRFKLLSHENLND